MEVQECRCVRTLSPWRRNGLDRLALKSLIRHTRTHTHTLHRSWWHTLKMTRYTDSNQQHWMWRQTFWEQTNLLPPVTEWWTDGHTDAWRQVKRRSDNMGGVKTREAKWRCAWWTDKAKTERKEKMMPAGGQTGALPPLGGLNMEYRVLHTAAHTLSTPAWILRLDYWSHWDWQISKDNRGVFDLSSDSV